jgi:hypothetical protein
MAQLQAAALKPFRRELERLRPARHVLRGNIIDDLDRVGLDRSADRYELQHVEASLAVLVLGDEALGLLSRPATSAWVSSADFRAPL